MRGPVTKICEACGQVFECGQYNCWCGKVGITEQQMDWIATRYKDCLCRACLEQVAAGELGPPALPSNLQPRRTSETGDA